MTDITINSDDGAQISAYLAKPGSGPAPGIVVLQEIFGVNPAMRSIADDLALKGYLALVPDLFWRQEPNLQLSDKTDWDRALELYQGFDENAGIRDATAALAQLRTLPGCSGKAGSIGFCLGGKLAYLMATRSDADCSVAYYGVGIEAALDEATNIKKPLLLHVAEDDDFVPPEAQAQVADALAANRWVNRYSYAGVGHAFARPGGTHYDIAAASLAEQRTTEFLALHLG